MAKDDTEIESNTGPDNTLSEPGGAQDLLERGTSVGRYVIIDFIDAGGMGAIYQAFDPELNRPVALKLLSIKTDKQRSLKDQETDRSRMLREAQALAQLTHPNVVTVYDVGEYQDSIFIAMEFVQGSDLNEWRKENNPSLDEVLAKVIDAGKGLAAAHQAGIIHRDFKPGNMIVGEDGRVRVLDFGLARAAGTADKKKAAAEAQERVSAITRSGSESSKNMLSGSLTQDGLLVGTISYMAPEQMDQNPVDERSDQFSFCITLYEALYGCKPFAGTKVRQLFRRMKRESFVRPLDTKVPQWLDDVLVRGLSFNHEDRFASMDELMEALQSDPEILHRELRDKRKRMVMVVGSISLSLLIGALSIWYAVTLGDRLCKGVEDKLVGVWDPEVRASVKKAFLATKRYYAENSFERVATILDRRVSQWMAMRTDACKATHVRGEQSEQMLDLRMRCYKRKLSEMNALVTLFATQTDGRVIDKAVQATSGLSGLSRCADEESLASEIPPPEDPIKRKKVEVLRKNLDEVDALRRSGKYKEGMRLVRMSLAQAKSLDFKPVEAEAMYLLGRLQEITGKYEDALKTLADTAALADEFKHDEIRAKANNELIWVIGYRLGRLEDIESLIKRSKAVIGRLGDQGEITARWHNIVGTVFAQKKDDDRALIYFKKALKIRKKIFGLQSTYVAESHNGLGLVLYDMGESKQALVHLETALKIKENALGPEHPDLAGLHLNIGLLVSQWGDFGRALRHYEKTQKIDKEALGSEHPFMAGSYNNIGNLYYEMGDYSLALENHQEALRIREKSFAPESWDVAASLDSIASIYHAMSEYDLALVYFERAQKIWEKILLPEQTDLTWSLNGIGWVKMQQGKPTEAKKYFEQVLSICDIGKCKGEGQGPLSESKLGLAKILSNRKQGQQKALQLAQVAKEFFQTQKSVKGKMYLKEANEILKKHGN